MNKSSFDIEFENCPSILKNFFYYLGTIRGREINTIMTYYYNLKHFFLYIIYYKGVTEELSDSYNDLSLINEELIKDIKKEDIESYLYYSAKSNNTKNTTRGNYLSAIKQYFEYMCFTERIIPENPASHIGSPKKPKRLPKYLTEEQALNLLLAVEKSDSSYKIRDECILILFLNCAIRISELVQLNYKDIRTDNTILIHGKGNKERILYLNEACINAINKYKEVRPTDVKDKEAFFISRHNKRLSSNSVRSIVEKYMTAIGLGGQGYSPHKLRHTSATYYYKNGVDIRVLQEILGHSNLGTTEIYAHVANEQVKSALESNPLSPSTKRNNN